MRKKEVLGLVLVMGSVFIASYFFPQIPDYMSIDMFGKEVSRVSGVFFFPVLTVFLWVFYKMMDRGDPFRINFDVFREEAEDFLNAVLVLVLYFQYITMIWNSGYPYYDSQVSIPFFSLLIYSAGVLVSRAERGGLNVFRTPWTLKSKEVRRRTHERAGFFLKIVGVMGMAGVFFPSLSIFFITVPLVTALFWLIIYSYSEYRKKSV